MADTEDTADSAAKKNFLRGVIHVKMSPLEITKKQFNIQNFMKKRIFPPKPSINIKIVPTISKQAGSLVNVETERWTLDGPLVINIINGKL